MCSDEGESRHIKKQEAVKKIVNGEAKREKKYKKIIISSILQGERQAFKRY